VRSLFRFVLIKLRHYGHLALSSCLMLRAKLVLYLVELKACVPKLCVLLYSAVLSCAAACLVCHCSKLRFVNLVSIKTYYHHQHRQVACPSKSNPGYKSGFSDWSGSRCQSDRSQNVVDSFPCRNQSFHRVLWKAAGDCIRNANKSSKMPYSVMLRKVVSDPESVSERGLAPNVNRFFPLLGSIVTPSFSEIGWLLFQ